MIFSARKIVAPAIIALLVVFAGLSFGTNASAATSIPAGCPVCAAGPQAPGTACPASAASNDPYCGDTANNQEIHTSINFGCVHKGNAMLDLTFAIVRFLSNGAGLIIIGSLVWAGIQYSGSRGDPQSTAMAVNRIQNTFFALLLFIFAYAILNYLIPGHFLK